MYLSDYWHDDEDEDEIAIVPHKNEQLEPQVEDPEISVKKEKLPAQP